MKAVLLLIFIMTILSLCSCSDTVTDQQAPNPQQKSSAPSTQSVPAKIETPPPAPNAPNAQDLQPDLHLSGTRNTHISGAMIKDHVSGR